MERKETIRNAYRLTGSNDFYNGMITCSTLPGKAVCRLVWGMNKAECDDYLARAISSAAFSFVMAKAGNKKGRASFFQVPSST